MSALHPLLVFTGLWAAQVALPGPNFVRVSSAAFNQSARLALVTSLGTAAGNSIWCLVAATSAAAVAESFVLSTMLRLAGAGYFAWYGADLLRRAFSPAKPAQPSARPRAGGRAFFDGASTALANPQTALFLATALGSTFPTLPLATVALVVLVVAAVNCLWYGLVILVLSAPGPRVAYLRLKPLIEAVFGVLLLLAAVKLVRSVA